MSARNKLKDHRIVAQYEVDLTNVVGNGFNSRFNLLLGTKTINNVENGVGGAFFINNVDEDNGQYTLICNVRFSGSLDNNFFNVIFTPGVLTIKTALEFVPGSISGNNHDVRVRVWIDNVLVFDQTATRIRGADVWCKGGWQLNASSSGGVSGTITIDNIKAAYRSV